MRQRMGRFGRGWTYRYDKNVTEKSKDGSSFSEEDATIMES
jgi:hypothetical protein